MISNFINEYTQPKGMKTGPKVKVKVESQQMSPVNIRRRGKKRSMVDEKVEVEIMELLNIGRVPDNPTGRRKIRPDPGTVKPLYNNLKQSNLCITTLNSQTSV